MLIDNCASRYCRLAPFFRPGAVKVIHQKSQNVKNHNKKNHRPDGRLQKAMKFLCGLFHGTILILPVHYTISRSSHIPMSKKPDDYYFDEETDNCETVIEPEDVEAARKFFQE